MPASSTQYGSYQPNAVDPYPIESVLAKIVGENNPSSAANLLDEYQMQRATDAGNYAYETRQQHQFAKQQLAQQLQEQYLKSGLDAVQHRGGLTVMNAIAPGSLGNLSLGERADLEGGLTGLQNAKILEQSGSGAKSAAEAGRDITDEQAARASNGLLGPYGTPLSTRNILIKEAGSNARHASGAATAGMPNFSAQLPADPDNPDVTWNMSLPRKSGLTPQQALEVARQQGIYKPRVITPLPDRNAPAGSTPPATTPLQPNANRPPVASTASRSIDVHQQIESKVENQVRMQNPNAYKDITAGKVGGKVNIVGTTPDGRPIVQGKSGQRYQ